MLMVRPAIFEMLFLDKSKTLAIIAIGALIMQTSSVSAVGTENPRAADLVVTGGDVYTVDEKNAWARALAVTDGKISYVGDEEGVKSFIGADTKQINLDGGLLLPGFHDCHVHLVEGGVEQSQLNLDGAWTVPEIEERIREYARTHPQLTWLIGANWALPTFPDANPSKELLDRLVPDRPVYLISQDGHSGWANSAALEKAGINAQTKDPDKGRIERDPKTGEPTGTLRESAMELVEDIMPKPTEAEFIEGARRAQEMANSFGITSVQDACAEEETLKAYCALEKKGQLTLKVVAAMCTERDKGGEQVKELETFREKYSAGKVRAAAAKIFADGVVEAHTAALLEPYSDSKTGDRGELNVEPDKLSSLIDELNAKNFQIHIHAIGDRAVQTALDALESVKKKQGGFTGRPHMAHLQLIAPDDLPRFKDLGVTANFQSYWAFRDKYVEQLTVPHLGEERTARSYPICSVLKAGGRVAAGSDWTVSTLNPLDAMQIAVTRTNPDDPKAQPLNASERVDLKDIIAAYTINGAYVNGQEKETGSLEVGKAADLVFIDKNLFKVAATDIAKCKVKMTMLDGKVVFERTLAGAKR